MTAFNRTIGCDIPLMPIHIAAARLSRRPIPAEIITHLIDEFGLGRHVSDFFCE